MSKKQSFGVFVFLLSFIFNPLLLESFVIEDQKIELTPLKVLLYGLQTCVLLYSILVIFTQKIYGKFLFSVSIFIMTFGLAESYFIFSKILVPKTYKQRQAFLYEFLNSDPDLDFKPKPNLKNHEISWLGGHIKAQYSTDTLGFRNVGISIDKSDTFFIGDSFTWGVWVEREKTFTGLLRQKGHQIYNLSVEGYSHYHYQKLYDLYCSDRQGSTIVLFLFANDLHQSHIHKTNKYSGSWKAYQSFPIAPRTMSYNLLKLLGSNSKAQKISNQESEKIYQIDSHQFGYYEFASKSYIQRQEYLAVEGFYNEFLAKIQKQKQKLVICLFPSVQAVYRDQLTEINPNYGSYLENEEAGFKRFEKWAQQNQIQYINFLPLLRKHKQKKKIFLDRDTHFDLEGHELVAHTLEKVLN